MHSNLKKTQQQGIYNGNWHYTISLLNPDKSSTDSYIDSLGGRVAFNKLADSQVKVSGARKWSALKGKKKSSVYDINWEGTCTLAVENDVVLHKFELQNPNGPFNGMQGIIKLALKYDSNNDVIDGWIHYVPKMEFLTLLASRHEKGQKLRSSANQWLNAFGKIKFTR